MSVSIGQTIDSRYRIDQEIAVGGMGAVYQATDLRLGKTVAFKVLAPHFVSDPSFQSRFRSEAQTMAMLEHLHIVQVTDFAEQPGLCYLVMDLISGGSLARLLKSYRDNGQWFPEQDAINLCRQVAEGLAYAHSKGVIHRDIKPDNLLIVKVQGANGTVTQIVKIADFGIARLRHSLPGNQHLTTMGSFIGTLGYAPLEQLAGQPIDERSDIYALGAVFYALLTGAPTLAFAPTDTDHQRFIKALDLQRTGRITPASALRGDISPASLAILDSCLSSDPARRLPSAAALSTALEAAGSAALHPSVPPGPTRPPIFGPVGGTMPIGPTTAAGQLPPTARITQSALNLPRVRLTDASGQPRTIDLSSAGLTVGRAADNTLALADQGASSRHLRIDWDGTQVTVTDLGSTNGTLLNGQRLSPHQPTPWPWQASLQVARSFLQLDEPTPGTAPIAPPGLTLPMTQALQSGAPLVIDVGTGDQALTLTPGQPRAFSVLLANAGQQVDHLKITVEGVPSAWVSGLPAQPVALNPNQNNHATLQLTAVVPRVAASKADDHEVIIRASSTANPGVMATAKVRWTVLPFAASRLELAPRRSQSKEQGKHTLAIHNDGNGPVAYTLSAEDAELALNYTFGSAVLKLKPGERMDVPLVIEPKRRDLTAERTHIFTATAQPDGGGAALTVQGEFVQEVIGGPNRLIKAVARRVGCLPRLLLALLALFLLRPVGVFALTEIGKAMKTMKTMDAEPFYTAAIFVSDILNPFPDQHPYLNRAMYYSIINRTRSAIDDYKRAIDINKNGPFSAYAYYRIGQESEEIRDYAQAVDSYKSAILEDQSDDDRASICGSALAALKRLDPTYSGPRCGGNGL